MSCLCNKFPLLVIPSTFKGSTTQVVHLHRRFVGYYAILCVHYTMLCMWANKQLLQLLKHSSGSTKRFLLVLFIRCTDAEASNTVEIAIGKKGGTFPLPFGGQLTVAADAFTKRAVITCTQVLPQDRYQFEPTLR
jgi:hypothetical protein